jgi:3',5'-cyclic AMP phosphodiesterase CpdA
VTTLVHISDMHFGTERPEVVAALVRCVNENRVDLAVLSGDITQRARARQFAAAGDFAANLGVRSVVIPGNHDLPLFDLYTRLVNPYRNYRRVFGSELEPSPETPQLLVICVNTTRVYRHKHGEVSVAQVDAVSRRLAASPRSQARIVVTHQPISVTRERDTRNLLRGSELAAEQWAQAGADLVLGGHIHFPSLSLLSDRYPRVQRRVWAVQAGTAVSHRVRDGVPNSINRIKILPELRCMVERWDFNASSVRFELVDAQELPLDRS